MVQSITRWETVSWGDKIHLFQHAVERDITSFLAVGSNGETLQDNALGTALSESGLSRDEIQLIGGIQGIPEDSSDLIDQVENFLTRLSTDYLDLLFIDPKFPIDLLRSAVERLIVQGKLVEIGIYGVPGSFADPDEAFKARLSNWNFNSIAMKDLPRSSSKIPEMMWVHLDQTEPQKAALKGLAEKYDCSPEELLLAWFLQHPGHFHPVLESNDLPSLDWAAQAHHLEIIAEDWQKIPELLK